MTELPDAEQVLDQCEKECKKVCAQEYSNPVTRRLCADMCLLECHRQSQQI